MSVYDDIFIVELDDEVDDNITIVSFAPMSMVKIDGRFVTLVDDINRPDGYPVWYCTFHKQIGGMIYACQMLINHDMKCSGIYCKLDDYKPSRQLLCCLDYKPSRSQIEEWARKYVQSI